MRLRQQRASRAIAILLVCAIAQVYVVIGFAQTPPQFLARLASTRGGSITINGNPASAGANIVTSANIRTGADQTATIDIENYGTLVLGPNTEVTLDYDQNGNTKVTIVSGCAVLTMKNRAEGEVSTSDGSAGKTDKERGGALDVCFLDGKATVNSGAAASAINTAGTGGSVSTGGGLSNGVWAAILLGIGVAIAVPLLLFRDDDRASPSPST